MNAFDATLQEYGADLDRVRRFDASGPDLLPYATLVAARNTADPVLAPLAGVYEWQDSPLVFLIDGDELQGDEEHLNQVRRLLAMRGDAPYLGVVLPGQLTLYRLALDQGGSNKARVALDIPPDQRSMTLAYLGNERPGLPSRGRWISDVILTLLSASIDDLIGLGVSSNDAISLVGRALFTRFLGDRELLPRSIAPDDPKEMAALFDIPGQAKKTSDWLDDTFNGDFLPLTKGVFRELPKEGFGTLGAIMRRAVGRQFFLGWEEKWDMLNFAHIPVGVLSQAYESYLKQHDPLRQQKEGGYYTPVHIADLMVRGAFHALRRDDFADKAKVLDPACGGGVFLLTAFRQLVAERWKHDGVQPDTRTLREILYGQVTGFDFNEAALRFAALGLYLISIELDPHPKPVSKLSFKKLRDRVLHYFGEEDGSEVSGSLGDRVGRKHVGNYDLVIGNPPWSSANKVPYWDEVKKAVVRIARERFPNESLTPHLPNEVMDLPFVWRAMEWAKPNGQISFALHARLFFQQGDSMPEARSALFRALNITGIINGTDLRQTKVWPEVSAPFCLMFARNQLPPLGAGFRFISPRLERPLNKAGGLRVDASNAELVASEQVVERPEILKILFRGSVLDLEIYDRLKSRELITLEHFWKAQFGVTGRQLNFAGNGYQSKRDSTKKPMSAAHLSGMPNLAAEGISELLLDTNMLPRFDLPYLHRARKAEIYKAPILIVHKSPPANSDRIRVAVADNDLVFSATYYGYSARKHPNGKQLVRYLALVLSSKIALWYALISSGAFGFERDVVEKFIIDSIPLPPFDALKRSDMDQIDPLFDAISKSDSDESWAHVDSWVASLYGLRQRDLQIIADTLRFNLPFSKNKKAAQVRPSKKDISAFRQTLAAELKPWAKRSGASIKVTDVSLPQTSPWGIVRIGFQEISSHPTIETDLGNWTEVIRVADQIAATEILLPDQNTRCI